MSQPEIVFKFEGKLPPAKIMEDKKVKVDINHEGTIFTAYLNGKSWRKANVTAAELPLWGAAIKGKLGQKTQRGFEVKEAGIQVYEKKAKELKQENQEND